MTTLTKCMVHLNLKNNIKEVKAKNYISRNISNLLSTNTHTVHKNIRADCSLEELLLYK